MKKIFTLLVLFFLFFAVSVNAGPRISFQDLMANAEQNPSILKSIKVIAASENLPVEIYTKDKTIIAAKGIEDGKIVYAVIKDIANIYNGSAVMNYDEVNSAFNISTSRLVFADGRIIDNTGGVYNVIPSMRRGLNKLLLVPEWTNDNVYAFDAVTGDLVDINFIPSTPTALGSPKQALQNYKNKILVSDQITDGVYMFDTNGTYVRLFAPAGGINTSILDNLRGINFRSNNNLLVTVGSGASQSTIQQFDTAGVSMGAFMSTNVNSPFDICMRSNDILVTNSSGVNDVTKYNLDGTFNSVFVTSTPLGFPQSIQRLANGNISVSAFNGTSSGLHIFDSTGTPITVHTGVTGNRGSWQLPSGNFLVTNGGGIHEISGITGALIRTIVVSANFQFFGLYDPDILVGVTPVNTSTVVNEYKLYTNYPNPFNPETNIRYSIHKKDFVSVKIFNSIGKEVGSFVNRIQDAGEYEFKFNAANLSSGVYYYKLVTNEFSETQKMILLK